MPLRMSQHAVRTAALVASALTVAAAAAASNVPLPEGCDPARAGVPAAGTPSTAPFPPIQLQVRTPFEPTVLPSAGRNYLVYELHLQNFSTDAMAIRGIHVFDADKHAGGPLADISEAQVAARLRRITIGDNAGDLRRLASGQASVAFLCLAFDSGVPVPSRLRHRILLDGAAVDGPAIATRATALRVLGRPVDGWDPLESTCRHASLSIL